MPLTKRLGITRLRILYKVVTETVSRKLLIEAVFKFLSIFEALSNSAHLIHNTKVLMLAKLT